ncbi:MAG TPA: cysteine desulfurase family protein [Acidimicrobiales bacterium]
MPRHYLDHASSAPLRPEAARAMQQAFTLAGADPGRLHLEGRATRQAVETAREQVAELVGVRPRQVVFTSGGTEAANSAVWGAAQARPGSPILCAPVEHSAVRDASLRAAPVEPLAVDGTGRIDVEAVRAALSLPAPRRPALLHCQWANHEVGTLQPVAELVALGHAFDVPVHVDAAAACGQVPLDLGSLGADLVSLSAHKFGGPPGIGALVVRRGLRMAPFVVGGQQERARRGGMENVPGIVGFGAAAEALGADGGRRLLVEAAAARARTARVVEAARAVPGVGVVGDPDFGPDHHLPHLVCLGVDGVEAEPVLLGLDRAGVAVHSGSACSSESLEPSPVLEAMGVDAERSLRVSVGWSTVDADVEAFSHAFGAVVGELRALR